MTEDIRILIADDHAVVREGLRALIDVEPGMELVGEAADGIEAVQKARTLQPDVILLDLVMPRKDGIEAIGEIKGGTPTRASWASPALRRTTRSSPPSRPGRWAIC